MESVEGRRWLLYGKKLFIIRQLLDYVPIPANYWKLVFWWYRFQNSLMIRDIDLKFNMGVVFERLEDVVHIFLPGTVHKYRNSKKFTILKWTGFKANFSFVIALKSSEF